MAKMVNCKSCGEEIAKSAKTCPHCGAKQKKPVGLVVVLLIVVVVIIVVAAGGSNKPRKVEDTTPSTPGNTVTQPETAAPAPTPEPTPTQQTTFGKGEKVELNDVVVTLVDVTETPGDNMFLKPADGKVFVLCEFEIENQSSAEINVSSLLSFEAYVDDYATSLSISALGSTDKPQLDGTVAAGKKMNGVVGYEVDQNWSNIEVHFEPSFWSSKDITFVHDK